MPKTAAERQQECRARKAALQEPAKKAGSRITRLLCDHSEKLAKFNAFMLQMNREVRDAQRSTGAKTA
jgi:hypothetical protein